MTEQYSAYQTLAAQAAITQQLRAASDTSQVGVKWGDHHGEWGRGCFFLHLFQIFKFSSKIWGDNAMSQQALATQVALAQYVQQVQQANQAQVNPHFRAVPKSTKS